MNESWYQKGLRFECKRCGGCCRGEPGYVWLSGPEAIAVAGFLGMTVVAFDEQFCRRLGERTSLIEKTNGDCVFWEHTIGCSIYPVRPTQCRTFPFWKQNVSSDTSWKTLAKRCPGVGHGKLYKAEEIRKRIGKNT